MAIMKIKKQNFTIPVAKFLESNLSIPVERFLESFLRLFKGFHTLLFFHVFLRFKQIKAYRRFS